MNNKITFPRLAALLADKSGRSKRFSEDFLRELFTLIGEQLEAGESVKVKGLGTFRLLRVEPRKSVDVTTGLPMEISGHSKVTFTPAKELAEAVNAPFEAFTAVEIGEDIDINSIAGEEEIIVQDDSQEILLSSAEVTEEILPQVQDEISVGNETRSEEIEPEESFEPAETIAPEETIAPAEEAEPAESVEWEEAILQEEATEPKETVDKSVSIGPKVLTSKTTIDDDDIVIVDDGPKEDSTTDRKWGNASYSRAKGEENKINWPRTLLICAGCAMLGIIATFVIWSLLTKPDFSEVENNEIYSYQQYSDNRTDDYAEEETVEEISKESDNVDEAEVEEESSVEEAVPTAPSDAVVYDTIGKSRYLTTMAKDHYGNNKLWPYIYEENKSRIGHPDRIRPGTPIVIPKLSKYGINPSDPKDIEKANKLGVEIYARYGKSI